MRKVSGLTLCGKRILQYCDTNRDNRLSQAEWTKCLDVAMGRFGWLPMSTSKFTNHFFAEDSDVEMVTHSTIRHSIGERRGPNPLKTWLNDD